MTGAVELTLRMTPPVARYATYQPWIKRWAAGVLRVTGVEVHVVAPPPPLDASRPRLVVSNHRTALDIPTLLSIFGGAVVSRADLATWPIIGAAATQAGCIFVDHESSTSGREAIRTMRQRFEAKQTVCIFPEGTTYGGDEVRAFQAGAFAACAGYDVEVIPVGLAWEPKEIEFVEHDFGKHVQRIGVTAGIRVGVAIGSPVAPAANARQRALDAHDVVQELVYRARERLNGR